LNCRVVVVARNRLGTINHTLLTISALLEYGVKRDALSVVLMSQGRKDLSSRTNRRVLADLLKTVPVLEIPFLIAKISSRAEILRSSRKLGKILKKLAARSEPV
jgi:dethiobiotin synthetase